MEQRLTRPPAYEWPHGHRCAVVFSADVDAESPYLWMNRGRPIDTLGELEQRRFGPRRGLARIVDLLDEFEVKGSFYVPGITMERYPWIVPGLLGEGHEVGLHGYYHERMETLDETAFTDVMRRSLDRYSEQGGMLPVGFRSPAWELGLGQIALLKQAGIDYDSSLMGYDHPYSIDGLTEIPVQWLVDDAIYFRYFGGGRDTGPPVNPMQVLESWITEFDAIADYRGLFMITVHPWMSGRGQRITMLRRLFSHIRNTDGIWWTTAAEIARWHRESPNAKRFAVAEETVDTDF